MRCVLVRVGLAACCAITLAAVVDVDFTRVRIRVVRSPRASLGGRLDIALPDTAALAGQAIAIVVRARGQGPGTRIVRIVLGGSELARVRLPEGEEVRVDIGLHPGARPARVIDSSSAPRPTDGR